MVPSGFSTHRITVIANAKVVTLRRVVKHKVVTA